jgi:electron transfer flavoprotein beta subunit
MRILVCVKQVCDPDGPIRIGASGQEIEAIPDALFRMNRFDEFALEEALRIREKFPGTRIDALSAGPERAAQTVRRALEMGADEGIHILLNDDRYRMPFEIASLIGAFASDKHYDLILTGVMAEDDMQGQVGPMLAEILGYPWAMSVMAIKLKDHGDRPHFPETIQVERELEGGRREAFELTLPVLLTVQSGINRPRYPSLSHVLRARSQSLITIGAAQERAAGPVSLPAPRERIVNLEEPPPMKTGMILSGSPMEKAEKLLLILRERAFTINGDLLKSPFSPPLAGGNEGEVEKT